MGIAADRFPLFPLAIVLLPGEIVPLHIFEDRYKLMIGECIEQETEFGIVWLSDDGLREVGCSARITEVLDRTGDGRMNILVTGQSPFRLVRRIDDMPYPAGDVEFLDDDHPAPQLDPQLAIDARERYADLVERVTDERPDQDDLSELDAYGMAATIEFDAAAKQDLLELRSEEARLRRIDELFRATVSRIEQAAERSELARSNGKIHL